MIKLVYKKGKTEIYKNRKFVTYYNGTIGEAFLPYCWKSKKNVVVYRDEFESNML